MDYGDGKKRADFVMGLISTPIEQMVCTNNFPREEVTRKLDPKLGNRIDGNDIKYELRGGTWACKRV